MGTIRVAILALLIALTILATTIVNAAIAAHLDADRASETELKRAKQRCNPPSLKRVKGHYT